MKGTISHVSTCHHGLLVQCILCGFISAERYRPYHGFDRHFDGQAKRKEFVVFVWGSDVKQFSLKGSSKKIINCKLKVQGKGLCRVIFWGLALDKSYVIAFSIFPYIFL